MDYTPHENSGSHWLLKTVMEHDSPEIPCAEF